MDISDFAIRGVLMQDGRPIAYENKKLDACQKRWPTHEKEFFVVVHCLKMWQHNLGLHKTKVNTNNKSLKYIEMQVSAEQLRWHDTLVLINVHLIHKLDCNNVVLDVLSKHEEFQAMNTIQALWLIYKGDGNLQLKITEGYMKDSKIQRLLDELCKGKALKEVKLMDMLIKNK